MLISAVSAWLEDDDWLVELIELDDGLLEETPRLELDEATIEDKTLEEIAEDSATDETVELLAGATEDAGLGVLEPPPPPQAVSDPNSDRVMSCFSRVINRSYIYLI